ncbi:MAG: thioredoxin family protein [Erysipelotrichaceae bacterium]|nr:thioredoxin family protein [Erysipelotrichaceae bacterium]
MKKLVIISAVWCPSCLILNKHLKKVQEEYTNIEFLKLDYDLDDEQVDAYHVGEKLPVMVMEDDNHHEIARLVGEKSYDEIVRFIEEN